MMLLFQAFKSYSRYNAPLNKCAFSSEKYALLTRNTCFCQKSVLLVRIYSYIATPMTMGHKVIKHPCLQISTPADLKTLQCCAKKMNSMQLSRGLYFSLPC